MDAAVPMLHHNVHATCMLWNIKTSEGVCANTRCHPQESGLQGNEQNGMFHRARDMAGRPQTVFDYMCRLLVPLCAARAAEEVLYGRDSMTLSTASEVRRCCIWSDMLNFDAANHVGHICHEHCSMVSCSKWQHACN